jgi:two-component system, CitB family, response regulator
MIQVLIVEDDVRIAEINRRFLEKIAGFEVAGIATDGAQAKDLLDILTPDLVLLDFYVPETRGFDLLRFIKQHHHRTDIVMITAAKELHTVREAIHGGVFDYIVKPVIFDRFREAMENYKRFREKLTALEYAESDKQVDQSMIDSLLRGNARSDKLERVSGMPKGIDKLTLDKVTACIGSSDEAYTAEQVSAALGISRSTSRRYLEYLASMEVIDADLSYGTVGRPERVYRKRKEGAHKKSPSRDG